MLNLANRFRQTSICLNNCYKNKYIARSITVVSIFSYLYIHRYHLFISLASLSLATQTHENEVNDKTVTSQLYEKKSK